MKMAGAGSFSLCEDLWIDVLCRCTEKDLVRFMCVCKGWYFLISQVCIPKISNKASVVGLYFRTLALSDHMPDAPDESTTTRAVSYDRVMFEYASLDDLSCPTRHPGFKFIESCNGLLLFVRESVCQYLVCNPLFKQCVQIPKAREHESSSTYAALAFDPFESIHYKIVRFSRFESELVKLDIFSSDTGQWVSQAIKLDHFVRDPKWANYSVYLNGMIYSLSFSRHLLCLDLNAMNGHVIKFPKAEVGCVGCIGVWKGQFCYAKSEQFSKVLIWSLEGHCEAGFEWVLKYSFSPYRSLANLVLTLGHPRDELLWFEPCAFHPNSEVIFFGTPCMILRYDLKSNRFEKVFRTRDRTRCYYPYYIVARCLVSLRNEGLMRSTSAQLEMITGCMDVLQLEVPFTDPDRVFVGAS